MTVDPQANFWVGSLHVPNYFIHLTIEAQRAQEKEFHTKLMLQVAHNSCSFVQGTTGYNFFHPPDPVA